MAEKQEKESKKEIEKPQPTEDSAKGELDNSGDDKLGGHVEKKETPQPQKKQTAPKQEKEKPELEREYIIPLRKKIQKVPKYKRAKKAVKVIKEFLAKHMKVENRDISKIKIDKYLNQEIWFRGIKKPPAKIKIKASKNSDGIVKAELAEIPEKVKWDIAREKKKKEIAKSKPKKEKPAEEKTKEEKQDEEEKEKASVEAGLKAQKQEAKQIKHTAKIEKGPKHQFRKALKK